MNEHWCLTERRKEKCRRVAIKEMEERQWGWERKQEGGGQRKQKGGGEGGGSKKEKYRKGRVDMRKRRRRHDGKEILGGETYWSRGEITTVQINNYKFWCSHDLTPPLFTFIKCLYTSYSNKIFITLIPQESPKPLRICKVAVLRSLTMLSLPRRR